MAIGIYASVFLEFIPNYHCSSSCLDKGHMEWFSNHSCVIPRSWNESCQMEDGTIGKSNFEFEISPLDGTHLVLDILSSLTQ